MGKVIQFPINKVKNDNDGWTLEKIKNYDFDLLEQRIFEAIDQRKRDYEKQINY